jgi:tetratricopeptide (TPR) repeat protein
MRTLLAALLVLVLAATAPAQAAGDPPHQARLEQLAVELRAFLQDAAATRPDDAEGALTGRAQRLATEFDVFVRDYPQVAEGWFLYARLLQVSGNAREAAAMFRKALEVDATLHVAHYQIANYLAATGEHVRALPYYLRAIELSPEQAQYHYDLAEVLVEHGADFVAKGVLTQEARDRSLQEAYRRASELRPDDVDIALRYAESFDDVAAPDRDLAVTTWERVAARAPVGSILQQAAWLRMARHRFRQGREDEARTIAARVTHPALRESVARAFEPASP